MRERSAIFVVGSIVLASVTVCAAAPSSSPAAAAGLASRFETAPPCRLTDVRAGTGFERVDPQIVRVPVVDRCGVPVNASAVALTVTVDNTLSHEPGYASVWPAGEPVPTASIVNYLGGEARANAAIVGVGAGGAIGVLTRNGAPVVIDVTGWFVPTAASTDGRFVPIAPTRAVDTRQPPRAWPMQAGETIDVPLPIGVPADAVAVALTVTLTESPAPGFFTVFPAGTEPPLASTVNADRRGQTRAAGAIVAVSESGIGVYSSSGGHVIVDVTGWFTGPSAPAGDDGLFVAEPAPRRLIDTRAGDPIWPSGAVEIANVAADAAALALNVAIVNPFGPAYLSAYPARHPRPPTSTVNAVSAGDVAAAMAIVPTSAAGVGIYTNAGADVVADVAGWFVGTPATAGTGPPENVRPQTCATSVEAAGLERYFVEGHQLAGADYQRVVALPDGRYLWLFQDVYIRGRNGTSTFAHNAALVQADQCFTVLYSGTFANPGEYLFPDQTQRWRHWFWPLAGDVGADGRFHLFVAEMRENGTSYLTHTEPIRTWKVAIDLATMEVVDRRPAVDPSASLYGFSVQSDGGYTYLFAHCHRQFGWDAFPFVDPPVYVHDWDCAARMTVARIPRGQFDQPLQYWNGSTWVASAGQAANIAPGGRLVSASQMYVVDGKWVSVTKVGDWFGTHVEIDVANAPQGPYQTVRTIATPAKCSDCNTYFPSLLPYRAGDGSLLLGISNNVFGSFDLSRYHPTFFVTPVV